MRKTFLIVGKICKKTFVNASKIANFVNVFFRELFPLYGNLYVRLAELPWVFGVIVEVNGCYGI